MALCKSYADFTTVRDDMNRIFKHLKIRTRKNKNSMPPTVKNPKRKEMKLCTHKTFVFFMNLFDMGRHRLISLQFKEGDFNKFANLVCSVDKLLKHNYKHVYGVENKSEEYLLTAAKIKKAKAELNDKKFMQALEHELYLINFDKERSVQQIHDNVILLYQLMRKKAVHNLIREKLEIYLHVLQNLKDCLKILDDCVNKELYCYLMSAWKVCVNVIFPMGSEKLILHELSSIPYIDLD